MSKAMRMGLLLAVAVLGAVVARAGDSAPILLDTMEGTRIAREVETIAYSTEWNGGGSVRVAVDGVVLKEATGPAEGDVAWNAAAAGAGEHVLTHVSGGVTLEARFTVRDKEETIGGTTWHYTLSNGVATVTGAEPAEGNLAIPAELGGCPVRGIGDEAFYGCTNLTSVTIPDSMTSIGDNVFSLCSSLATVYVPASWEGTDMLVNAGLQSGCEVVYRKRGGVQLWEGGPYWAETNIGAEKPWEYGLYFWWGDTVGYKREGSAWVASDGSRANFSFSSGNTPTYGKTTATLQSEGWTDASGNLAPEHDAAQAHWGGGWRMPTDAEFADLISNTTTIWTNLNGVYGRLVTGKGDYAAASIFLPAAGYGYGTSLGDSGSDGSYWSSTPDSSDSDYAWNLFFYYGDFYRSSYYYSRSSRDHGRSVRALRGFAEEPPPAGEVTWKYSVSNGAATVTGAEPAVGDLAIPAELGGCPVRAIGEGAFSDCSGLTAVRIPGSVTNIGTGAFEGCSGLTSLELPGSVRRIEAFAFESCDGLTSVAIPNGVEYIGNGAFGFCDGVQSISRNSPTIDHIPNIKRKDKGHFGGRPLCRDDLR